MSWIAEAATIFDVVISVLLVIAICYAIKLERALKVIREARNGMGDVVAEFSTSVDRAEQGVSQISAAAAESGTKLKQQVEAADRLADDLALLQKRAELAAERVEETIAKARNEASAARGLQDAVKEQVRWGAEEKPAIIGKAETRSQDVGTELEQMADATNPPSPEKPMSEEQSRLLKVLQDMR